MGKEPVGFSIDEALVEQLDEITTAADDLDADRSEVADAIFTAFFSTDEDHVATVRELIIKKRKGKL
jgi:hypothetical protein